MSDTRRKAARLIHGFFPCRGEGGERKMEEGCRFIIKLGDKRKEGSVHMLIRGLNDDQRLEQAELRWSPRGKWYSPSSCESMQIRSKQIWRKINSSGSGLGSVRRSKEEEVWELLGAAFFLFYFFLDASCQKIAVSSHQNLHAHLHPCPLWRLQISKQSPECFGFQ